MQSMFRSMILLAALGLFAMVGCKDGDKAAEGADKKENTEKKEPTCDDAWSTTSKFAPEGIEGAKLEQAKQGFMAVCKQLPPEKVKCISGAKTQADAEKCIQ